MSKLSLSETNWINLVFEYKNKGYGAASFASRKRKTFLFSLSWVSYYVVLLSFPRIVSLINPEKPY
jgi:protein TonB